MENDQHHKERIKSELKKAGDYFELFDTRSESDNESNLLGYCYRPTDQGTNPIYVSVGNKMSWETCLWILNVGYKCLKWRYRIPEPIRMADILTREFLRNSHHIV